MENIIEAQLIIEKSPEFDLDSYTNYLQQYGCTDIQFSETESELTVNFVSTLEMYGECLSNISEYGNLVVNSHFDPSTISPEVE